MSAGTLPPRETGHIWSAEPDARRARRLRRTRRRRRAALAAAGVCALVLGEALAHVAAWWPSDRLKEGVISVIAPPSIGSEVVDRAYEPVPLDAPLAVDIPAAPAFVAAGSANGVAGGSPYNRNGVPGVNGVAGAPTSAIRSSGVGLAPSDNGKAASAQPAGPGDSGAVAAVSRLPAPRAKAESAGGGDSPSAQDPAAATADALKRAAAEALVRERNINKVRNYPDRPSSHVGND